MLQGKKIIIAISGSIAAYKTAALTRLLVKEGAEVQIIMTADAMQFITPLTLSTLSKNPVASEFVKNEQGEWTNHVELGLWADLILIAPATANTLAKMAHGICDNLLIATYLSAKCPVMFAPAMDLDMYLHPSTQNSIQKLLSFGNHLIDARSGELASGLVGQGRMAEPEEILEECKSFFQKKNDLANRKVLITAGPTYESIDPVRFIGNHSTGKMGYALAHECAERGAEVTLISGPSNERVSHPLIQLIKVQSAEEMYNACSPLFENTDIAIMSAAVADYKPEKIADQKIKKKEADMQISLVKTIDILSSLGSKKTKQVLIGFALETENELENAQQKLQKKNADMIVLNSLQESGAGFGHDTNKVSILLRDAVPQHFSLKSKKQVAVDIINLAITLLPS